MQIKTVTKSPDLQRIRALPFRSHTPEATAQIQEFWTRKLRTTRGTMQLRDHQALALHEIYTTGGLVGAIRVGGGKTLISFLAPVVLASKRPMLLLPASLIEKTRHDLEELSEHWQVHRGISLVSYESLGRVSASSFFVDHAPDLILADEAHRAKNRKAAVTRRLVRYMQHAPNTKAVFLSGTLIKSTLSDVNHLARFALKAGSPFPHEDHTAKIWDDAVSVSKNGLDVTSPGELLFAFPAPEDGNEKAQARQGLQRRVLQTAGVISTGGDRISCSLQIRPLRYSVKPETDAHFEKLRNEWVLPDGWALSEAIDIWRHAQELALGLHYTWDPRPKDEWLDARKAWAQFVRGVLKESRTLDSEHAVALEVTAGRMRTPTLGIWKAVRPTFEINSVPVWHDDSALLVAQDWIEKGPGKHGGIVWCEHRHFAAELARRTGVPYYGRKGLDANGVRIDDPANPSAGKAAIASISSNCTGRNLQHSWSRNLVVSVPPGSTTWEQMLGRTHRDGQQADEVTVDVLLGCAEHLEAVHHARIQARKIADLMGEEQKLLIADLVWPARVDESGARWDKSVSDKVLDAQDDWFSDETQDK